MKALVQIGQQIHEFDTGHKLPLTTRLTLRACPNSPAKTYDLVLSVIDNGSGMAVYRVAAERTE